MRSTSPRCYHSTQTRNADRPVAGSVARRRGGDCGPSKGQPLGHVSDGANIFFRAIGAVLPSCVRALRSALHGGRLRAQALAGTVSWNGSRYLSEGERVRAGTFRGSHNGSSADPPGVRHPGQNRRQSFLVSVTEAEPNQVVQATPYSLRSYLAPAFRRA